MAGLFISFEGVDGVGKTTQVKRLCDYATSAGYSVVITREPGGTPLGVALRRLLLHGVEGSTTDIAPRAEALIFAADRAQHVAETIRPALSRGAIVITDRYLDSSLAYQAGGRELTVDEVRALSMWATHDLLPDRTYVLDMDPSAAHSRLTHGADRMESAGDDFQERTRRAFCTMAKIEPQRFRVINAEQNVDAVFQEIRMDFDQLLATHQPSLQGGTTHAEPTSHGGMQ